MTATVRKTMSSPPLRGTAEWSATREAALLLGLASGNRYAAQQLWLRKERIKAEASQAASAGPPQASQQPAGCRAKPAPAQAQAVPKQKTPAQLARNERSRERLFQKHLAKVAKVHPMLQAWLRAPGLASCSLRSFSQYRQRAATPTRPSVAVPESGAGQPPFQAKVVTQPEATLGRTPALSPPRFGHLQSFVLPRAPARLGPSIAGRRPCHEQEHVAAPGLC